MYVCVCIENVENIFEYKRDIMMRFNAKKMSTGMMVTTKKKKKFNINFIEL
jgi:hypothetical protein